MSQPFLTYRETNENGELVYFILQKDFPHYLGYVSNTRVEKALAQATVSGYNTQIIFCGCINGFVIPSYKGTINQMQFIMEQMAEWFLVNRINVEPKKYLKFKINATSGL